MSGFDFVKLTIVGILFWLLVALASILVLIKFGG